MGENNNHTDSFLAREQINLNVKLKILNNLGYVQLFLK